MTQVLPKPDGVDTKGAWEAKATLSLKRMGMHPNAANCSHCSRMTQGTPLQALQRSMLHISLQYNLRRSTSIHCVTKASDGRAIKAHITFGNAVLLLRIDRGSTASFNGQPAPRIVFSSSSVAAMDGLATTCLIAALLTGSTLCGRPPKQVECAHDTRQSRLPHVQQGGPAPGINPKVDVVLIGHRRLCAAG